MRPSDAAPPRGFRRRPRPSPAPPPRPAGARLLPRRLLADDLLLRALLGRRAFAHERRGGPRRTRRPRGVVDDRLHATPEGVLVGPCEGRPVQAPTKSRSGRIVRDAQRANVQGRTAAPLPDGVVDAENHDHEHPAVASVLRHGGGRRGTSSSSTGPRACGSTTRTGGATSTGARASGTRTPGHGRQEIVQAAMAADGQARGQPALRRHRQPRPAPGARRTPRLARARRRRQDFLRVGLAPTPSTRP